MGDSEMSGEEGGKFVGEEGGEFVGEAQARNSTEKIRLIDYVSIQTHAFQVDEILLGKALKQLPREKIQLATKFGISRGQGSGFTVDTSVPIEDTVGELRN
ncbi:hypothetical protein QL285_095168 [Trifolium repens]|nr:hypothetical protein QL285_095168 [Trifolium repens]